MSTTLTDHQWQRILSFLKAHPRVHVGPIDRCRRFVSTILWVLRTGAQWREIPVACGHWNSVYKRFRAWASAGVLDDMLVDLSHDADREWLCLDSTIIRAHMCAAGAPHNRGGQQAQSLGRSRGGFSTKIHVKVDAHGNPLAIALTAGHRHDNLGYRLLRQDSDRQASAAMMDKAYDCNWLRDDLKQRGIEAVIPSNKSRTWAIPYDKHLYKHRHVVECFINKIKWFRRVFTRFDKLDVAYKAFIAFASVLVWLR